MLKFLKANVWHVLVGAAIGAGGAYTAGKHDWVALVVAALLGSGLASTPNGVQLFAAKGESDTAGK